MTPKQQSRMLNGHHVGMMPKWLKTVYGPNGIRATVVLPPEEIIRSIEEWRIAWPEMARMPNLKEIYDGIYEEAQKKVAQKQAENAAGQE